MLKYRILTALVLIPLFLTLLFTLPPNYFALLTGAIVIAGAHEWLAFAGLKNNAIYYLAGILVLLLLSLMIPLTLVLGLSLAAWGIALYLVLTYPRTKVMWGKSTLYRAVMGLFVLIPCWLALNFIRNLENGPYLLLFLFVLIWGADSAAYFIGRKWGKRKLAPEVSPGKTVEGLVGALIISILLTLVTVLFLKIPFKAGLAGVILSVFTVLFSVIGDLFESMLKRNIGAKDSGHLLPGHGGILDRVDSLTAAAPIFALGLLLFENFFR